MSKHLASFMNSFIHSTVLSLCHFCWGPERSKYKAYQNPCYVELLLQGERGKVDYKQKTSTIYSKLEGEMSQKNRAGGD
jgi:hypothetical protein